MKIFILIIIAFSYIYALDMDIYSILGKIKTKNNPYMSIIEEKKTHGLNTLDETFASYKLKLAVDANLQTSVISSDLKETKTILTGGKLSASKMQPSLWGANGQLIYAFSQDKSSASDIATYSLSQEILWQYSQPLTLGGAVKNHYALLIYPLQKKILLLNLLDEINQYYYQVLSMYLSLLREQQQIYIVNENIKNMSTFNAISLQKYNQGNISSMEYNKTKLELNKLKLEQERYNLAKQINNRYFQDKLGLEHSLTLNINFSPLPEINPEILTLDSIIDIRVKKLELEKIEYDIESIYGEQTPELSLSGQFKRYNQATKYEDSLSYAKTDWAILSSFKYPFFDEGSTRQKAFNLKIQKTILEQQLYLLQIYYETKIKDLTKRLELLQKNIGLYEENKKLANEVYKVDQKRYIDGVISYYEMIQSLQNLNNIEIDYSNFLYDMELIKIDILLLTGRLVNL